MSDFPPFADIGRWQVNRTEPQFLWIWQPKADRQLSARLARVWAERSKPPNDGPVPQIVIKGGSRVAAADVEWRATPDDDEH